MGQVVSLGESTGIRIMCAADSSMYVCVCVRVSAVRLER